MTCALASFLFGDSFWPFGKYAPFYFLRTGPLPELWRLGRSSHCHHSRSRESNDFAIFGGGYIYVSYRATPTLPIHTARQLRRSRDTPVLFLVEVPGVEPGSEIWIAVFHLSELREKSITEFVHALAAAESRALRVPGRTMDGTDIARSGYGLCALRRCRARRAEYRCRRFQTRPNSF